MLEPSPKKKIKLGENKSSVEMGSKKDDSNSFVQFENVGFRTNGSFVVKVRNPFEAQLTFHDSQPLK